MKLPTEIKGNKKLRDSKLLSIWTRDGATMEELASRFGISTSRVHQIIYRNKHLVKIDKEYEKLKRLAILKRMLNKHPQEIGKKDTLDIVDAMRIETEGNKVEHTGQTQEKIVIIYHPDYKKDNIGITSTTLPNEVSRF